MNSNSVIPPVGGGNVRLCDIGILDHSQSTYIGHYKTIYNINITSIMDKFVTPEYVSKILEFQLQKVP